EVPGVDADDLDITLEDGLLTIQGERRVASESSEQQYHRVERPSGSFPRSIPLPSQVQADAIEASFENGGLEVVVPKAEEAKPKKITVRAGGGRQQAPRTPTPAAGGGGGGRGRRPRPATPDPTMPPGEGRRSAASPLCQRGHREEHRCPAGGGARARHRRGPRGRAGRGGRRRR